jgi:hypothetical protein
MLNDQIDILKAGHTRSKICMLRGNQGTILFLWWCTPCPDFVELWSWGLFLKVLNRGRLCELAKLPTLSFWREHKTSETIATINGWCVFLPALMSLIFADRKSKWHLKYSLVHEVLTFHREGSLSGPSFLLLVFGEQHISHISVEELAPMRSWELY